MYEALQHLQQAVADLTHQADRLEDWREPYLNTLVRERIAAITGDIEAFARQVERAPEGLEHMGRQLAEGAYVSVKQVPFPGVGVHLVYPLEGQWDEVTELGLRVNPEPGDSMEIVAYLDTDNQQLIDRALGALEGVADSLGYGDIQVVEELRGSIFRRATSWLKSGVQSDEVAFRLAQVERAIQLGAIDTKQAEVDEMTARAVESLVASVADIPRVAMRAGSILLIKYIEGTEPVVLVRQLSSVELTALERHPGLQREPESLLANLAALIQQQTFQIPPTLS